MHLAKGAVTSSCEACNEFLLVTLHAEHWLYQLLSFASVVNAQVLAG